MKTNLCFVLIALLFLAFTVVPVSAQQMPDQADTPQTRTFTIQEEGMSQDYITVITYRLEDGKIIEVRKNGEPLGETSFHEYEDAVKKDREESSANPDLTRTITIKHTGFFSKKSTEITYRLSDSTIVKVEVNGVPVPKRDFPKYQDSVYDALELENIIKLEPEVAEADVLLQSPVIPLHRKREYADSLLTILSRMKSTYGRSLYGSFKSDAHSYLVQSDLDLRILRTSLVAHLRDVKNDSTIMLETIEYKKGNCLVNGEQESGELSRELYKIYQRTMERKLKEKESVFINFNECQDPE